MDVTKPDVLVTGGNVVTPTPTPVKKKRIKLTYLRGTGVGAKRLQELLLLAKAQNFEFEGSWEYRHRLWYHRIVLFNFIWIAHEYDSTALDEAMTKVVQAHHFHFE